MRKTEIKENYSFMSESGEEISGEVSAEILDNGRVKIKCDGYFICVFDPSKGLTIHQSCGFNRVFTNPNDLQRVKVFNVDNEQYTISNFVED